MNGSTGTGGPGSPLAGGLRWRRVFPGRERELAALRRWLSSLLPECPACDDVLTVANELASNAIQHTLSGHGAWFAVEVTWHPAVVQIAVADCGGPSKPRVINDPGAERGRGLLMVQGLSIRTGHTGDQRGRLVWAQVPWTAPNPPVPVASRDPYQAAVRDGEAALARRFAGVPAWFGRSTLAWWAVVGPAGLVSAPTARELAGLLYRLLDTPQPPRSQAARAPSRTSHQRPQPPGIPRPHGQPGNREVGPATTGLEHPHGQRPGRRPAFTPGLTATA
jgi:serine/threonine-protein kinase RsbW